MTDELAHLDPDKKFNPHDEYFAMTGYAAPNTLDKETTTRAFMTYHQACINEICANGQYPSSEGITDFGLTVVVSDIVRRSRLSGLPWEYFLNHVMGRIHELGHQVTGTPCAIVEEEDDESE